MALLDVTDLKTYFHTRNGIVKAVDGVSFSVDKGETLGIVGESGSGKSVSNYALMRLIPMPPGRIEGGRAIFDGIDLLACANETIRKIRGRRIAMIFQDPMTSLNPYMRVSSQLIEPLLLHEKISKKNALARAIDALESVGILDAEKRIHFYPHEFSGGMRQRVMIAMAMITKPDLLIADEPTTALDVTVQAQVLDLIKALQRDVGTAVIFITHDLGVIARVSDYVAVMYAGKVMESGTSDDIFYHTEHPYTRALLRSIPSTHEKGDQLYTIQGLPPDVSREIVGCPFAPRCELVSEPCLSGTIATRQMGENHFSRCIRSGRE